MFEELLKNYNCKIAARINNYSGASLIKSGIVNLMDLSGTKASINLDGIEWDVNFQIVQTEQGEFDLKLLFILKSTEHKEASAGLSIEFEGWSMDNYVLMPAAVYNGNRFESRKIHYPPMFTDDRDINADIKTIITDVPRLNISEGPSRIQLLTRDMSTPGIAFYSPENNKGFILLTKQGCEFGDYGISIEESYNKSTAVISVTAPGVREEYRYILCDSNVPSKDRGADFKRGDAVELALKLVFFEGSSLQSLFDRFSHVRKSLTGKVELCHSIPFSSAWEIQEKKYNLQNWEEEYGYYSVGMRDSVQQDWQIGWVGGVIATYPLLFEGTSLSRERALRNLQFVFSGGQDASGFFYGCGHKGEWYGDNFLDLKKKWHLIRKSSDALYFIIKQFMLLKKQGLTDNIKPHWEDGARKCADAFVRLWSKYGQFGQFVDTQTGDIIVGGSASAAIAPAALTLAWEYFGNEEYLKTAEKAADYFYEHFVKAGYTTGGPGEILQCPDSESAFGLLETYVILYESTKDNKWLKFAEEQANQCITWCVSYDFKFPLNSTFGKLNMHTAGSVYANVQNKHSSPGICTLSGDSLFKLFRATGKGLYLELIREIAHNLPQYLSREDRPIPGLVGYWIDKTLDEVHLKDMPPGWMNERVEMSDWLEPVGEIFYGSCWCEVSNMLTYVEIPGLYVQIDTGLVCSIDNIEAEILEKDDKSIKLKLYNSTCFKARVKVFAEYSQDAKRPIGQNALWGCRVLEIEPGKEAIAIFS